MKRFLALVLIFVFALAPMASFADDVTPEEPVPPYDEVAPIVTQIKKTLTVEGDVKNPAETFTFSFTGPDGAPVIENVVISFTEGEVVEGTPVVLSGDIGLPEYTVLGSYVYDVEEVIPTPATAGMTYDTLKGKLTVLVTNNPDSADGKPFNVTAYLVLVRDDVKEEDFENTFSGANLEIKKEVTGSLGDKELEFEVKVTVVIPAGQIANNVYIDDVPQDPFTGTEVFELKIKHGQTINITNLPAGATYTVEEVNVPTEYTVTIDGTETNKVEGEVETTDLKHEIVNDYDMAPPMGITLDNLPYIIMLAVAAMGMVFFVARKRTEEN